MLWERPTTTALVPDATSGADGRNSGRRVADLSTASRPSEAAQGVAGPAASQVPAPVGAATATCTTVSPVRATRSHHKESVCTWASVSLPMPA